MTSAFFCFIVLVVVAAVVVGMFNSLKCGHFMFCHLKTKKKSEKRAKISRKRLFKPLLAVFMDF